MNKILSMVAIMALSSMTVSAGGTTAGTSVDNQATLSFTVGGVSQTDVPSNTDTFVVDKKVDFLVTNNDSEQVSVVPGETDKLTTWSIKNDGNLPQKFTFTATQLTNSESIYNDADTTDSEALTLEYENGAVWTALTTLEVAVDVTINIRIKTNIATTKVDGDVMNIKLQAIAVDANNVAEVATSGADNKASMDIVLAEAADGTGDLKENGTFIVWGGYKVAAPNLALKKSSCVLEDVVNGVDANAKRIPGATVLYILDIHNSGTSTDAIDVTITDTLAATLKSDTVTNVQTHDAQNAVCTCANGVAYGGAAATNTVVNSILTITGLTVTQNTHNCVSFEVDII